ncbi:MAG: hypothetical protein ACYCVY_12180 [Acidiferrobacteraceae bacterium]
MTSLPSLNTAFIVPSDSPPDPTFVKQQLLVFDQVILANREDAALLNSGEMQEQFPGMTVTRIAPTAPFPRTLDYEERYSHLLREADLFVRRGIVRVSSSTQPPIYQEPGSTYLAFQAAISNEALVRSAIPDYSERGNPAAALREGIYQGFITVPVGLKSQFSVDNAPYMVPDVQPQWSDLAHVRVGRMMKYLRRVYTEGYCPVVSDHINESILYQITSQFMYRFPTDASDLSGLAISLDVFDSNAMETLLRGMTWTDVAQLRKQVLPHMANLRRAISKGSTHLRDAATTDLDAHRKQVYRMQEEFAGKKEALADALRALGIESVLSVFELVAGGAGLHFIIPQLSWTDAFVGLVAGALAVPGKVKHSLAQYLVARRKVSSHPLFFVYRLNGQK